MSELPTVLHFASTMLATCTFDCVSRCFLLAIRVKCMQSAQKLIMDGMCRQNVDDILTVVDSGSYVCYLSSITCYAVIINDINVSFDTIIIYAKVCVAFQEVTAQSFPFQYTSQIVVPTSFKRMNFFVCAFSHKSIASMTSNGKILVHPPMTRINEFWSIS